MNARGWLRRITMDRGAPAVAGRAVAVTGLMALTMGLLPAFPLEAIADPGDEPAARNDERKVPGRNLKVEPRKANGETAKPVKVAWPRPTTAEVAVPASPGATARAGEVPAPVQAGKWVCPVNGVTRSCSGQLRAAVRRPSKAMSKALRAAFQRAIQRLRPVPVGSRLITAR